MKPLGLSLLAAIVRYFIGLFGGMSLVETFSSNAHDRSMEAAMTGAFVIGPVAALVAVLVTIIYGLRRR
jgi:type IV secretory pathway VirB2 component (pilin)